MTAIHLLDAHPGAHCSTAGPSALAEFFRRLVRSWRRKAAAPEIPLAHSGAAYPRPTLYARLDGDVIVDEQNRIHVRAARPVRATETRADLVSLVRPYAPDVAA